jgi:hypothetical protein
MKMKRDIKKNIYITGYKPHAYMKMLYIYIQGNDCVLIKRNTQKYNMYDLYVTMVE